MKKQLFTLLAMMLLALPLSACPYSNKKEIQTAYETEKRGFVILSYHDKVLESVWITKNDIRYNVLTQDGDYLASNISRKELADQFPQLEGQLKS